VAGDGGTDDLDDYARPGDSTFFGGTYPALTWGAYMETALKDLPVEQFGQPAYVNRDSAPTPTVSSRPEPTETREPETEQPTQDPTSEAPSQQPSTEAPTQQPSTERPSSRPTTARPSQEPTQSRTPGNSGNNGGNGGEGAGDGG
jgi:hypothetical protein